MGRNVSTDRYTDAGKAMLKSITKLAKRPYVKVGFPASTDKPHKDMAGKISGKKLVSSLLREMGADIAADAEPITLAELAIVHEFGSEGGRIPERGPIRATHDKKQREWWEAVQKLKLNVLIGRMSTRQALGLLGEIIKKDLQAAYRRGGDPYVKNAQSTIDAKGSSTPLVNTSQLLNGVNYERVNAD